MHDNDLDVYGDIVINHRCAQYQNEDGVYNVFGGKLSWDSDAIVCDDPNFAGTGNASTGEIFHAAPNIDHNQEFVRHDLTNWMKWLRLDIGFDGFRFDFVRGFDASYIHEYVEQAQMSNVIGEFWDGMRYDHDGHLSYDQDEHRQRIIDWIDRTKQSANAFDFTTKGVLQEALSKKQYWRLIDQNGNPPGVVGWWPEKAITFIDNHDTGSPQMHWPFPYECLLQGYAYILTHAGTPMVFYDHLYDPNLHTHLTKLIKIRKKYDIQETCSMHNIEASNERYVVNIDDKLVLTIGYPCMRKGATVFEYDDVYICEYS
jgi:alpha-amylase